MVTRMKIVVNTRLLRKDQMDGIGWFTYNTMKHVVNAHPEIEFHFLFDSEIDNDFIFSDNVHPHKLFPPAKHAVLNIAWFEWNVKKTLNKIKPDLFLSPDGILCLGWNGRQYAVIHDINFHHKPEDLKWSNQKYYNYFFPRYAEKACRIGTVSRYSKNDIVNTYGIQASKIDVLYNGIQSFFKPVNQEIKSSVKFAYTEGEDFFIFIGTLHPRKNIIRLLVAFDRFKTETKQPIKLLIVGKGMYKMDEIRNFHQRMSNPNSVVFTGRLQNEEMNNVLASALALVFVPYFEGFGIPIIEAMQCEVPVICSNITSMPEVAGDAAILVDPYNVEAIKNAMANVAADAQLRKLLIEKGNVRKHFFSWEKTANLLWESVTRCL